MKYAIDSIGIYRAGDIFIDHGDLGFIFELVPKDTNGIYSLFDTDIDEIKKFLESIGQGEIIENEEICSLRFIHSCFLTKKLSNLLGFNVVLDRDNPHNNQRYVPNIAALNARLNLLKVLAQQLHLPGSENISDIFFYPVTGKLSDSLEYIKLASLSGFPIASFADGGNGLGYHDQVHLLQLMLPKFLLDGYANYIKDALSFMSFAYSRGYKNYLGVIDVLARSVDAELPNLLLRYRRAMLDANYNASVDGNYSQAQFDKAFKKYIESLQADYYNQVDARQNYTPRDSSSGKPYPSFFSSAAEESNSFFPRLNDLIKASRISIAQPDLLLQLLNDFRSSRYALEHDLHNKSYYPNGIELYLLLDKHVHFMTSLSNYPEIRKALALPDF